MTCDPTDHRVLSSTDEDRPERTRRPRLEDPLELRDYLRILWQRRWLVVLVFAIGATSAIAISAQRPSTYKATAKLFIGPQAVDRTDVAQSLEQLTFSKDFIASYAELLRSRTLAEHVVERLDLSILPVKLVKRITTKVIPDTRIIEVSVTDQNPERSALIANTLTQAFVEDIQSEFGARSGVKVTTFEPAVRPSRRISPIVWRDGVLGGILGLVVGMAIAFLLAQLDTRLRSKEDVEHALAPIPVLTEVPALIGRGRDLFIETDSKSHAAEAFRILRTNVQFLGVDKPIKRILVTSPYAQDGKSTVAANLAASLAAAGYKTLLIDADLRRPTVHEYLNLPATPGVSEVLVGRTSLKEATRSTRIPNLFALPSGSLPPNPSELLGSQRMVDLMDQASALVDIVVVDSPPTIPVTDPVVLAPHTDGVILVARAGRTQREKAKGAVAQFERGGVRVLGVVLNGTSQAESSYYYYNYYRGERTPLSNGSARKTSIEETDIGVRSEDH